MKLICLNIWGGTLYEPLMAFVKQHAADTDIFCFQEIFDTPTDRTSMEYGSARPDIYRELKKSLPEYQSFYAPCQDRLQFGESSPLADFPVSHGLGIFVRKSVPVLASGDRFVIGERNTYVVGHWETLPRNVQYVTVAVGGKSVVIGNFHGVVEKASGKGDAELTLRQFRKLIEVLGGFSEPKIIVGDFNVRPETECIALFERVGYRNLIREHGVTLTRNRNYKGMEEFKDYVSDYAFVSPEITVLGFRVFSDEVSDHLALELQFD